VHDLKCPLLAQQIVSGLTGLSPRLLRRWEALGIPANSRRRRSGKRGGDGRLYSWDEVEQLQRATHLIRTRRLSLAEASRLLKQNADASLDRDWVIARPMPRLRRRRRSLGPGRPPGGSARRVR
jgi:DNA-binding transcriptional MerR regulator